MGMELARGHRESQAIQRGTSEEILEVLQTIVKRMDDRSLLNVQPLQPVEDQMKSLQMVRTVLSRIVLATLNSCQFRKSWVHLWNPVKGGRFQKDFRWPIVRPCFLHALLD